MLRITDFTQTDTGLAAPHLIFTRDGQEIDLGPLTRTTLAEFQTAAGELTAQYQRVILNWATAQSPHIAADIAQTLTADPAYGEVAVRANAEAVGFVYHGVYFDLHRVGEAWRLSWDAPVELNWAYDLPMLDFSGATVAHALQDELANLRRNDYPAPSTEEQTPTAIEHQAAQWVLRHVRNGGAFTAPEVAAIFNTGKYEYQPVRVPAIVLEILRQWPNYARPLRRPDNYRLAQWYLAYHPYLHKPESALVNPSAPTSIFLE